MNQAVISCDDCDDIISYWKDLFVDLGTAMIPPRHEIELYSDQVDANS
jgi:hypothetical protein